MNYFDWIVLCGTIAFIVIYGTLRTRKNATIESHLKADNSMKWWMIGVSIMATQASAVTFLSTPGQAIEDGMRFLQFYFGLPLAMVIISVTFVPIYYKLKVYTAYEYLENRFDLKTRALAAILFLILRGLSVGITLFAPALVLSTILSWPITLTTILIGGLVIVYVVSGGSKAVSLTQRYQMAVIMSGMVLAGILAFQMLPDDVSFTDTVQIAGELGKMNLVNLEFNLQDRYNIWSGLIAGTFLFLSYFGTDQSQVSRYLGGASLAESRMGLMFNGLLKIPMQFMILFIGILVYVFYLFNTPPVFHNTVLKEKAILTDQGKKIELLEKEYKAHHESKKEVVQGLVKSIHENNERDIKLAGDKVKQLQLEELAIRDTVKSAIANAIPGAKTQDRDYIFLNFVLTYLPHGIIGLLLAVMFSAAMSSMAGELSSLSITSTVDVYQRLFVKSAAGAHSVKAVKIFTILWAVIAMIFATLASFAENLIQFVNIVGSLFYGTILGIFLTAFYIKRISGTAVFYAAIISELVIFYLYRFHYESVAFLLYNIIACAIVVILSFVFQLLLPSRKIPEQK
jgi:SSS family solute:Na+ symporter